MGIIGFDFGTKLEIVYSAALKEFNGKESIDFIIKDFNV
jgi:hypothetical protein